MRATIRQNKWGNWYGYLGGKKVAWFHETATQSQEQQAKEWQAERQADIAARGIKSESFKRLEALWSVKPISI